MTTDERMDRFEERLDRLEALAQRIFNLAVGIAIGLVVAAFIFGIISLKEAKEIIS